ncbi:MULTISPECIES: CBS domain-containing protein [unclassified Leisingera]|uniref:CBS domain-containing protein n=1 Tax=unclassified Leisingera TaxID=2614906 RepID=UPI0002D5F408|nr:MULTISPECIES: CBS domain-containing protein [unclassified Leisingera]KIC23636.1 CBS domain protein [Leisingera sp. ANG-S3]KIC52207.1 CBS domain protein [Leisingera sp. ANG-S]KID09765.1 CBS domain protein [Leisingera sp. ANG1]
MLVHEIMTVPARFAAPQDSVGSAVQQMQNLGIGVLPVVEEGRVVGILTDRDLVLALAGQDSALEGLPVAAVMTPGVVCCQAEDTVEAAAALMGDHQIRRLPVLDEEGRLAGLLSITDIAVHASEQLAGEALGEIAEYR